jgi:predicted DNA-binding transcriptional regulator YafY
MRSIVVQTSARLLALLSLLQVRREWTGQELADRLEVGARTIRRDVDKLRSLGYPIEAAPGVAGGYRLGAGGELPPLLLDDAEAVAVAVGLRTAAAGGIAGIEETSVRALTKLEQVLPGRLRRRVSALSLATSSLHFSYTARDDQASARTVEPAAVVYSGHRWYLVAFDLDRDDWRTFRLDRIRGRVRAGERGRRRIVPGGDPAAFVRERLRGMWEGEAASEVVPGRVRLGAPAGRIRNRIPGRYAVVEPDGEEACIVTSRGRWSHGFLVWMATLDEPMEVLDPPEMVETARVIVTRLAGAAA